MEGNVAEGQLETAVPENRSTIVRNLIGFWLLGLTNNFAYVIMLSCAHDILTPASHPNNVTNSSSTEVENRTGHLVEYCNPIGTGAILLADIIPCLIAKLTAPFYLQKLSYGFKVWITIAFGTASFILVAIGGSAQIWLSIIGVVCASWGSGIGETVFLSLTSYFDKNCVSTWSSGTGAAGLLGSLSYAGMTAIGLSPRTTLLIMLVIPVVMAVSYFLLLVKPASLQSCQETEVNSEFDITSSGENIQVNEEQPIIDRSIENVKKDLTWQEKTALIKPLLLFMVPLMLVYFAEYFINQALFELIYFKNIFLPIEQQYRWYQAIYQLGVFISRSSVNLIHIRFLAVFPVLQFGNVVLLMCQVFFRYIPSIWIVFVIILYEGLLGGGTYVNTFYKMSNEISKDHLEFSIGVTTISDSVGITVAALVALPIHNLICRL